MKKISVYERGETVYFLTEVGFHRGTVEGISYVFNKSVDEEYRVWIRYRPDREPVLKYHKHVFKTLKELIEYYTAQYEENYGTK